VLLCVGLPASSTAQILSPASFEEREVTGTDLKGVVSDSFRMLVIEHAVRIGAQQKTRRELGGPFWKDYRRSVRMPRTWGDGDGWMANYVGHPVHGASAGFIWLNNTPDSTSHAFAESNGYWRSRVHATAWSTLYSLQFEIGPLSEASLGNVGKDPNTIGLVDHVITPVAGFGLMVAEDVLDQHVITWLESRVGNRFARAAFRLLLNPSRSFANLAGSRVPWYRSGRPLDAPSW
jgi:hypothetical protein